jgi:hypothetical protein
MLSKLAKGSKLEDTMKGKEDPDKKAAGRVEGEEKTTTITHHADGTHTMEHDGETSEHPDHLHMMAHLGHNLTGEKHHVAHHDGMSITTHGVHESGEHEGPQQHNSAEEAKESFGKFMDEEAKEPEHQQADGYQEREPSYGAM